jgi:hypothetical protein
MCGIAGFIGNREAASIVVSALEKMEYRGYDSADDPWRIVQPVIGIAGVDTLGAISQPEVLARLQTGFLFKDWLYHTGGNAGIDSALHDNQITPAQSLPDIDTGGNKRREIGRFVFSQRGREAENMHFTIPDGAHRVGGSFKFIAGAKEVEHLNIIFYI